MKKKIYCAIFISDVGFGHMIRQRQIIYSLRRDFKNIEITIFHKKNINILKKSFGKKIKYVVKHNHISFLTTKNGFLNKKKAIQNLKYWHKKTKIFISSKNKDLEKFDFFISDLVPEISYYAKKNNKPCFSVCHFTWDWFFKKLIQKKTESVKLMEQYIKMSTKIYFPPFTFPEILKNFTSKKKVNFITNKIFFRKINTRHKPKKILIMNNGTGALTNLINKTLPFLKDMKNYKFYISSNKLKKNDTKNIVLINSSLKNMYSYINKVDLVIARGGYNTISECLILKKPSILSNEQYNPEVNTNLRIMNKKHLCSTITYNDWDKYKLKKKIDIFVKKDYDLILRNIQKNNFKNNGSTQIVKDIKKEIKKFYDKNNR